jgi:DNA-binding NarL/FixJ family response regulator
MQVRNVAAELQILCVTKKISADVVQEALAAGGRGVVNTKVAIDLITAVTAVLEGGNLISDGHALPGVV